MRFANTSALIVGGISGIGLRTAQLFQALRPRPHAQLGSHEEVRGAQVI